MRRVQQQRSSNTQKGAVKATPAMPGKGSKRGRRETSTCPGTQAPESAEAEWTRWRISRCAVSLMGCGIKTAEKCELLVRCVANVCWSVHKAIYCTVPVFQLSAFSFQLSAFSTASSGASCGWDRRQQTSAAVVCCYCLVLPTTYGPCTRRFHLSYCTVLYSTCSCTVAPACLVPSHLHLSSLQPRSGCSKTCNLETTLRPLLCPYCCIHPRSHYADAPKGGEALQLLGNQAGNTSN